MKKIEADGDDVTEAVQVLYDIAHMSMDWGSGFLDNDEMETVIRLAILMGWQLPPLPGNSDPMRTLAEKFPEHYVVEVRHVPEQTGRNGYVHQAFDVVNIRVVKP